jgi:aminopeptidase N
MHRTPNRAGRRCGARPRPARRTTPASTPRWRADPSDAGLRSAAACRAAIPDVAHKEAAWRLLTSDGTGPETVTAVAGGFMQPEHADLLAPYAARYLSGMPGLWRTRDGHMRARPANALFPYPAVTSEFLTRIDEFITAGAADPGLARIVRDHRDTAERVLRTRALKPH